MIFFTYILPHSFLVSHSLSFLYCIFATKIITHTCINYELCIMNYELTHHGGIFIYIIGESGRRII